jgi:FMN reductase
MIPSIGRTRPRPRVVAVGGSLNAASSTQKALQVLLDHAARAGCDTCLITGPVLDLPFYSTSTKGRTEAARFLVEQLRDADGVFIGSPVYHGSISGVVKNALDYAEDLRDDERPYLSGRAVGVLATGGGWQGCVATLGALRDVVHALRGWNTPFGVPINTSVPEPVFASDGRCMDDITERQLALLAEQVVGCLGATTLAKSTSG